MRQVFRQNVTPERIVEAAMKAQEASTDEDTINIKVEDVIVDFSTMHYGMKEKNPLDSVGFYSKLHPDSALVTSFAFDSVLNSFQDVRKFNRAIARPSCPHSLPKTSCASSAKAKRNRTSGPSSKDTELFCYKCRRRRSSGPSPLRSRPMWRRMALKKISPQLSMPVALIHRTNHPLSR